MSLCLALAAAVLTLGPLQAGRDPASFPYVFLPAAAALLPLATDRLAAVLIAALLMLLFCAREVLTIGVYFLPAAAQCRTRDCFALRSRRRAAGRRAPFPRRRPL